jgi:hypothetical protein
MKKGNEFIETYEKVEKIAAIPETIRGLITLLSLISAAISNKQFILANKLIDEFVFGPGIYIIELYLKEIGIKSAIFSTRGNDIND